VDPVPVVALLPRIEEPVPAGGRDLGLAEQGAAVAGGGVAVVALLPGVEMSIPAVQPELWLAGGIAAVAAQGISIIALLAPFLETVSAARLCDRRRGEAGSEEAQPQKGELTNGTGIRPPGRGRNSTLAEGKKSVEAVTSFSPGSPLPWGSQGGQR
jgi:hypothetical protein